MLPGVKRCGPISATGVTSAAVPQMNTSEKVASSSAGMCRSTTSKPRCRASGDDAAAGDAVQEAVGRRGVDHPVAHQEDVGAGRLGDVAAPVQHQGVGVALPLGRVLGDGADHVEAGRLGRRSARSPARAACTWRRSGGCPWPSPRARNSSASPSRRWPCGWWCSGPRRRSSPTRARRSGGHRRPPARCARRSPCRPGRSRPR